MTDKFQSMSREIYKITDCLLYNDPRMSSMSHFFCVDCSKEPVESSSCPLCRPLLTIPDDGSKWRQCMRDLHQLFVENSLKLTGEKQFDTPLVEQFRVRRTKNKCVEVAWLENKIYVVHPGIKRVRVFADRAPFTELPDGIEIKGLVKPHRMVASAACRSIFISDNKIQCIWKIQMPRKELSHWYIGPERPSSMSITPNMELLISFWSFNFGHDDYSDDDSYPFYTTLSFYRLTDGSKTRSMDLPKDILSVTCTAELPNKSLVICYRKLISDFQIGVLSMDGNHLSFVRNLDLASFTSIQEKQWDPFFFTATDKGELFFADSDRIIWFNSDMTDYCVIKNHDHRIVEASYVVYVNEKQQLLVCGEEVGGSENESFVKVFHLSPCSLDREKNSGELVEEKIKLNRKHLVYNFTAKYKKFRNTNILTSCE